MEPLTYCQQTMDELRGKQAERFSGVAGQQVVVVLAYFADQKPAERDFASQLKLLAESAERTGRPSLAAAARAVLDDWQKRATGRPPAA